MSATVGHTIPRMSHDRNTSRNTSLSHNQKTTRQQGRNTSLPHNECNCNQSATAIRKSWTLPQPQNAQRYQAEAPAFADGSAPSTAGLAISTAAYCCLPTAATRCSWNLRWPSAAIHGPPEMTCPRTEPGQGAANTANGQPHLPPSLPHPHRKKQPHQKQPPHHPHQQLPSRHHAHRHRRRGGESTDRPLSAHKAVVSELRMVASKTKKSGKTTTIQHNFGM